MLKKALTLGIILVSIVIAYNLLTQIFNALKSEERLSDATQSLYNLEVKNKQLKQKLEKISSNEFIEEQARNKLGLGKKGETVVIIPDERLNQILGASESAQEKRLPNWLGWFRLFWK